MLAAAPAARGDALRLAVRRGSRSAPGPRRYVTVNETAGRALFYVFAEAAEAASLPLVLWLKCAPAPRAPAAGGARWGR